MLQNEVHLVTFHRALSEIWQPWHAFSGNPEKWISFFKVLNHKYAESDVIFWSGFPFYSKFAKLAVIWQPWKSKYLFFLKFYLKMTYGYLHSWLIVSEQRWLCVGEAHFHLFSSNWLSVEKDENGLRLHKVIFVPRLLIMNISSHMSF